MLALAIGVAARDARAGGVDRHVELGVVIAKGIRSFSARPTLGGDLTKVWSPSDQLELGFEAGAALTGLPYGRSDGPAMITHTDNTEEAFTLMPRLMFGPRFVPASNVRLGVSLGATWLWSAPAGELSIVPYPTANGALETWFGPNERFGLRAAFSYMHYWFGNGDDLTRNALMTSSLAFAWTN
jgi:hypothetical protein